jgi:transposase, IS30 family
MKYRRVTNKDRLLIKAYLDSGLNRSEIGIKLGFDRSTISRELQRNKGGRGYRVKQAQWFADMRQKYRQTPRRMTTVMKAVIDEKLKLRWSPEQISNRLKLEDKPSVSAETIYRYIYADTQSGGQLWRCLRRSRRRRKPRFPKENRRGVIQNARPISSRPKAANERKLVGHWERDTMLGKDRKTAILVCTDRKTRFNRFTKLNRRKAVEVTTKTTQALLGLPVRSITNDRGQEFNDSQALEAKVGVKVYFCDPYSSYQRGTNENRIGILRNYLPKRTDLNNLSWKYLKKIEFEINNRPMKCLDWRTPHEAISGKRCTAFV